MQTLRGGWGGGYGSRGGYGGGARRNDDGDFSPAYGSGTRGESGGTGSRGGRSDLTRSFGPRRTDTARAGGGGAGKAQADVPTLAVGERVTHDSYGLGTVVSLEGSGSSAVAKIDFGSGGTKRLLLRYSPVTKL